MKINQILKIYVHLNNKHTFLYQALNYFIG